MPEEQKAEKSGKSKGLKRWLIGGTLTAVAAGAFFVGPHIASKITGPESNLPQVTLTEPTSNDVTIVQEGNLYPALTKDQQLLRVYVDVKPLDSGDVNAAEFETALKEYTTAYLMASVQQYDLKDIPANLQKIQSDIAAGISSTLPVGIPAGETGAQPMAQAGTHFTAPTITEIRDAAGQTTYYSAGTARSAVTRFGL